MSNGTFSKPGGWRLRTGLEPPVGALMTKGPGGRECTTALRTRLGADLHIDFGPWRYTFRNWMDPPLLGFVTLGYPSHGVSLATVSSEIMNYHPAPVPGRIKCFGETSEEEKGTLTQH